MASTENTLTEILAAEEERVKNINNERRQSIDTLNSVIASAQRLLEQLGEGSPTKPRRGRPAKAKKGPSQASGKKRGRPAMSAAEKAAQSKKMKAYWKKRKAAEGGGKKK